MTKRDFILFSSTLHKLMDAQKLTGLDRGLPNATRQRGLPEKSGGQTIIA